MSVLNKLKILSPGDQPARQTTKREKSLVMLKCSISLREMHCFMSWSIRKFGSGPKPLSRNFPEEFHKTNLEQEVAQ